MAATAAAVISGLPPKVEPWVPGPRVSAISSRGDHGADGRPSGQGLGQGHDVGFDPFLLVGEKGPGAAAAHLDLVEDRSRPYSSQISRTARR